jgi:hypothetical protein
MALACVRVIAALVLSITVSFGCGDNSSTEQPPARVCTPGTVFDCVRGSCTGRQSCLADGSGFTRCLCDSDYADPAADGDGGPGDAGTPGRDASADGAAAAGKERCDNDLDDDGDGEIDCADADCSDVSCVLEAPRDWQGPVALREGSELGAECSGRFGQQAFRAGRQPSADAISCSTCSCNGAGDCAAFVDFGTGSGQDCGGMTCTTSVNQSCAEIMPPCLAGLTSAYLKTKLPSDPIGCTASQQNPTKPDVHWESQVRACRDDGAKRAGCDSGKLCLPKSAGSDFAEGYCVWREGEDDCPAQTFTHKQTYHREFDDTRECSACSCSGASCSYRWKIFNSGDTSCTAPILEIVDANQCVQVNPASDKLRVGVSIEAAGQCTASGGDGRGEVSATRPITVCCSQ